MRSLFGRTLTNFYPKWIHLQKIKDHQILVTHSEIGKGSRQSTMRKENDMNLRWMVIQTCARLSLRWTGALSLHREHLIWVSPMVRVSCCLIKDIVPPANQTISPIKTTLMTFKPCRISRLTWAKTQTNFGRFKYQSNKVIWQINPVDCHGMSAWYGAVYKNWWNGYAVAVVDSVIRTCCIDTD